MKSSWSTHFPPSVNSVTMLSSLIFVAASSVLGQADNILIIPFPFTGSHEFALRRLGEGLVHRGGHSVTQFVFKSELSRSVNESPVSVHYVVTKGVERLVLKNLSCVLRSYLTPKMSVWVQRNCMHYCNDNTILPPFGNRSSMKPTAGLDQNWSCLIISTYYTGKRMLGTFLH